MPLNIGVNSSKSFKSFEDMIALYQVKFKIVILCNKTKFKFTLTINGRICLN